MVSVEYIKKIMSIHDISQKELSEEWNNNRKDGLLKHQSSVSVALKRAYTDSLTMIKALSILSKIPISDIVNETAIFREKNTILYNVSEEPAGVYTKKDIPIVNNRDEKIGSINLSHDLIKVGVNRICQLDTAGMNIGDQDLLASVMIKPSKFSDLDNSKIHNIVTISGQSYVRRMRRKLDRERSVILVSDDPVNYPDVEVSFSDIVEIWEIAFKISWSFPQSNSNYGAIHRDVNNLSEVIDKIYQDVKDLKMRD